MNNTQAYVASELKQLLVILTTQQEIEAFRQFLHKYTLALLSTSDQDDLKVNTQDLLNLIQIGARYQPELSKYTNLIPCKTTVSLLKNRVDYVLDQLYEACKTLQKQNSEQQLEGQPAQDFSELVTALCQAAMVFLGKALSLGYLLQSLFSKDEVSDFTNDGSQKDLQIAEKLDQELKGV